MKRGEILRRVSSFAKPYRVGDGRRFRLSDFDPGDTGKLADADKPAAVDALRSGVQVLSELQDMLYAQDCWSLLLIFQAMDAAGKDGAIKHVMSGVNPQGVQVASFKAPSEEELDHDFLWRCTRHLPERGRIGIFNRSYYEEVLVVRVHPELLVRQRLPAEVVGKDLWEERFKSIRHFERHLAANGTVVCKFFLNVSRREQKKRFLERIEEPEKNWKFAAGDVAERQHWKAYMKAYEDMIRNTAVEHAPWYVVPADNKWFTRVVVGAAVIQALCDLGLHYPRIDRSKRAALLAARKQLLAE